jgi:PAS domain S-box-containing protein
MKVPLPPDEAEHRFRFLNDLGEATRTLSSPREIMATVARMLGVYLHASRCAYAEVQEDSEHFTILDDYTDGCASTAGRYHLSLFGSLACTELRAGRTLVIQDVDAQLAPENGANMFNEIGIKAIVCCPLLKQGALRAMMAVHQATPRGWTASEIALVEEVVERCWSIIERARDELALRDREEYLRFVIDASSDGIWEWDIASGEVYWSERIYAILGLSPESFKPGYPAQVALIHPDDLDTFERAIQDHLQSGKPYHLRVRYRHNDGSYIHVLAQGRMQHDAAGRPLRMIGSFSDLTSLMMVEAEREAKNREIVTIWESMTDAIYTLDAQWKFTHINSQAAFLLQRNAEELLGKSIWEEFPEAVGSVFEQEYRRAVAQQVKVDFEAFYPPLNGWFELHAYPSSLGLSVYFRNITERKQSVDALVERTRLAELNAAVGQALTSNESLEQILRRCAEVLVEHLDAAFARIWTLNQEENVLELSASAGMYTHLDGPHGRVPVGHWKIGLIAQERQPHLTNEVIGDPRISDQEWAKQEGMVAFAGYPMIVEDRLVGVLAVFARRPLTQATLQAMASAAAAVALGIERKWSEKVRTELLQKEQQARQEAESTNRIKDEFLATLSHELRTPLTAILGWSNLLRNGRLDEELAAQAADTIERNARAQVQLIDDLLDISRIVTGKFRLEVRPIDLRHTIGAAVDAVRPAAEGKGIQLQTFYDSNVGLVSADADRLQQVVWNLLTNAIKFTPASGQVRVRLEQVNSHLQITVSDTGKGLDAKFLPHIFDRFRQADQTSTRSYGGLGLGLSIVQQIVQLHGGTIHAESAGVGQGASFIVQLPRTSNRPAEEHIERRRPSVENHAPEDAADPDCASPLAHSALAQLRVLVVEDEADTQHLLRALLEGSGSQVATASSVAEALELFKQWQPEVLISDIGMPNEDGYALIRKVRAWEAQQGAARVPAIALTAYARAEDRVRALRAGFQIHVPKPIQPNELIATVASLVERTGG